MPRGLRIAKVCSAMVCCVCLALSWSTIVGCAKDPATRSADPVEQALREMRQAIAAEDIDGAISAINTAIAEAPERTDLLLLKARIYFDNNQMAKATLTSEQARGVLNAQKVVKSQELDQALALASPDMEVANAARAKLKQIPEELGQAWLIDAFAQRSLGHDVNATAAFDYAFRLFETVESQPPGDTDSEMQSAQQSAMLHQAVILSLTDRVDASLLILTRIEDRFPDWQGRSFWQSLLTSPDSEERIYDLLVEDMW